MFMFHLCVRALQFPPKVHNMHIRLFVDFRGPLVVNTTCQKTRKKNQVCRVFLSLREAFEQIVVMNAN